MHVTMQDIQRLIRNPSTPARADVAAKVATTLATGGFSDKETQIALDIIRLLVRDVETQVRLAVSVQLKDCMTAPHDVIMLLANDETEIAMPVLQHSPVLTEDDLVGLVKATHEVAKLAAIARRENISQGLSGELFATELHDVIKTLLANKGAVVEEVQVLRRWELIVADKALSEVLVHRGGLSPMVAEKLYAAVAEELKPALARMYRLPMIVVDEAVEDVREWATLGIAANEEDAAYSESDIERLVDHLYKNNRLTYSLIIRAICVGDLTFFEAAMARLAGVARVNARILMFDNGPLGFRAFYEKARMPEGFFEAIHTLLKISLEETQYGRIKRNDFREQVIRRIQAGRFDRTVENMQYLLTIIGGKIATPETIH